MKKVLRIFLNILLFLIFWCLQLLPLVAFSFEYIRIGPSGLIAFGGIITLFTSYFLVKKINKLKFWNKLFNEKEIVINLDNKIYEDNMINDKNKPDLENMPNPNFKNLISKGWIRLNIIFGILLGFIIHLICVLLFDESFFLIRGIQTTFIWPLLYFFFMWMFLLTKKYAKNIVSEIWMKRHILISLIVLIVLAVCYNPIFNDFLGMSNYDIIYYFNGEEVSYSWLQKSGVSYDDRTRFLFFSSNNFLFGLFFTFLYWFTIFSTVWVISGFNEDK